MVTTFRSTALRSYRSQWTTKQSKITDIPWEIMAKHGIRMRHIVICGLPRSTIFFSHYLINGTIFEKKSLNTKCVFWFSLQLLSETFLILRRTERDMIKNVYRSSCKIPVILCEITSFRCVADENFALQGHYSASICNSRGECSSYPSFFVRF